MNSTENNEFDIKEVRAIKNINNFIDYPV